MFDEARAFISNTDSSHYSDWYVWKDEWPDWQPVTEVEGLTEVIYRIMQVSPPPPPKGTGEKSMDLSNVKSLEIADEPSIRKVIEKNNIYPQVEEGPFTVSDGEFVVRGKKRFQKRFEITIEGPKNLSFKTHSRNISVGGISFEDSLPDWLSGYFKVKIAKPKGKQKIELMCCLVENQKPGERFRVAILPLESVKDEQSLETWLAA